MNLYEFEGKIFFEKYGIKIPQGFGVRHDENVKDVFKELGIEEVVVKAQVLSGKRGKNNAIRFCKTQEEVLSAVQDLFALEVRGQYVTAVRIEEKLDIAEEHYLSITYDTNSKQPVLIYSSEGGVDIENVGESKIRKLKLDITKEKVPVIASSAQTERRNPVGSSESDRIATSPTASCNDSIHDAAQKLWNLFLAEDCRLVEINPLVKTKGGDWVAADAKMVIDGDAFYRHGSAAIERAREKGKESPSNWEELEPRTMMGRPPTEREIAVQVIDAGEKYYQGTAGKYIEMDGDIAVLFSGGGASIANMDALRQNGLEPANYTEYSGNPPRQKVYELAKIVLSKPNLKGLWIAGGVANFTNVKETFQGIVDALDEVKPNYPIVVRRGGPFEKEEVSMGETAGILAEEIKNV
jgi:citryl-CoA synthetase large subunit